MTAGKIDPSVVRRHLLALQTVLGALEPHRGKPIEALAAIDERWIVERGLQLAAQNILDVATHLVAGSGREAVDYTSAIEQLGSIGAVTPSSQRRFAFLPASATSWFTATSRSTFRSCTPC